METSPYEIPETALRSWDPHSKRKAYFEGTAVRSNLSSELSPQPDTERR